MFGLTASQILGLSVIAALVTTVGNLLATWLREFLFVRSFERWKDRRTLLSVFRKYRDPMILAIRDLQPRVKQILADYPTNFLRLSVLEQRPRQLQANSADDPYYKRYRLISTVYRLCAFLGWLELYRQEVTFLDTGQESVNKNLEDQVNQIRQALANGRLNTEPDWRSWSDRLIFREEQRAIGEGMITGIDPRAVMGYGAFHALFERADAEMDADADDELWWIRVACSFFLDLERTKDFRRSRLEKMQKHLDAIEALLDSPSIAYRPAHVWRLPYRALRSASRPSRSSNPTPRN